MTSLSSARRWSETRWRVALSPPLPWPTLIASLASASRTLARDRWEDALDLLDRYTINVPFMQGIAVRRAIAELGASRAPTNATATDGHLEATKHRLASPGERGTLFAVERCKLSLWEQLRHLDEMGPRPFQVCKMTPVGRLDFLTDPPPRTATWAEPGTSLAALAPRAHRLVRGPRRRRTPGAGGRPGRAHLPDPRAPSPAPGARRPPGPDRRR